MVDSSGAAPPLSDVAVVLPVRNEAATLADAAPGSLDLIVVDAFSSDAIPVHLMTVEALKLYAALKVSCQRVALSFAVVPLFLITQCRR